MKSTVHCVLNDRGQVNFSYKNQIQNISGIARTVYGDHARYLDTYINVRLSERSNY